MHRLIYTSTATRMLERQELERLLNSARKANSAAGITGLLMYHEGCFLQVLEGDRQPVEACYERIGRDGRHTDCIELANEPATSRLFGDWWMAYRDIIELAPSQEKQFLDLRQLALSAGAMPMVQNLKVNAILLAFLSTFRDLELAG